MSNNLPNNREGQDLDGDLDRVLNSGIDALVLECDLEPKDWPLIVPTGFPHIGPALFNGPDGKRWCLVEGAASMANRLEAVCLRRVTVGGHEEPKWVDELDGLPLIVVELKGTDRDGWFSTLELAHRISSDYVVNAHPSGSQGSQLGKNTKKTNKTGQTFGDILKELQASKTFAELVFLFDPNAILHGYQFVAKGLTFRSQPRILSGEIYAAGVEDIRVWGVKFDRHQPNPEGSSNVGQALFEKGMISAERIFARFEIDLATLRHLPLGADDNSKKFAQRLLLKLALWKIYAFLTGKPALGPHGNLHSALRLRSQCWLVRKASSQSHATASPAGAAPAPRGRLTIYKAEGDFDQLKDLATRPGKASSCGQEGAADENNEAEQQATPATEPGASGCSTAAGERWEGLRVRAVVGGCLRDADCLDVAVPPPPRKQPTES